MRPFFFDFLSHSVRVVELFSFGYHSPAEGALGVLGNNAIVEFGWKGVAQQRKRPPIDSVSF